MVYVREGDAVFRSGGQAAGLAANNAWHGSGEVRIAGGLAGATLWRWELAPDKSASAAFPRAAKTNRSLFFAPKKEVARKRKALTVAEVHGQLDAMIGQRMARYASIRATSRRAVVAVP